MKELLVLLHGEVIGVLRQNQHGNRSFQYLENSDSSLVASLALPYREAPYPRRATDAFIEGLLPEGLGVRQALADQFGISPENPFALLEHIGLECAGAVQFCSSAELETAQRGSGELIRCTEKDIGDRLRSLTTQPKGSWLVSRERWSLAGAQSKFALRWDDGWCEATGAEPTTHIVKPGIYDFQDQALNEHLSLRTLAKAGLLVAESRFMDFDGAAAIVVERYDRHVSDSGVVRIHQEDFCQATSTLPRRKYESQGGPSALKIIHTLRQAGAGESEILRFVEGLIGNYLLGAPDAHAKNYSVLLAPGVVALAPLYDVASGFPYEYKNEHGFPDKKDGLRQAAMAIGGERRFSRITYKHWSRFAADAHIDEEWLITTVKALALLIPVALAEVLNEEQQAVGSSELPARLLPHVALHCETTITRLDH